MKDRTQMTHHRADDVPTLWPGSRVLLGERERAGDEGGTRS